ncbi:hypothetical protein [Bacillus thuringiensis]|uniref:hypothetical protein n=1 Tax=Bacillus thuringiensis TaxID=1428 RepID=UPI003B97D5B5|nr:hypothetical protein [Bacillus cereus]
MRINRQEGEPTIPTEVSPTTDSAKRFGRICCKTVQHDFIDYESIPRVRDTNRC